MNKFVDQLVAEYGFTTVTGRYQKLVEFNRFWSNECELFAEDGWPTGVQFESLD